MTQQVENSLEEECKSGEGELLRFLFSQALGVEGILRNFDAHEGNM